MSKLPLTVRKSIRDDYEAKRPDLESQISKALGVPWTISIDASAVYQYAGDGYGKQNPGGMFTSYIEGLIYCLQDYIEKHGEDGISELNNLASKHTISIDMTENPDISYCGCDIADGCLRIMFKKEYLGTNVSEAARNLHLAVNAAGIATAGADASASLDFNAKQSIKQQFQPKIDEFESKAQKIMAMPSLKFKVDFPALFAKLAAHSADDLPRDWQQRIGQDALTYFEGFVNAIEYQMFAYDEMLQGDFRRRCQRGWWS